MKGSRLFIFVLRFALLAVGYGAYTGMIPIPGNPFSNETSFVGKWETNLDPNKFTEDYFSLTFFEDKTGYMQYGPEVTHVTWNSAKGEISVFIPVEDPDVTEVVFSGKIDSSGDLVIGNDMFGVKYNLHK